MSDNTQPHQHSIHHNTLPLPESTDPPLLLIVGDGSTPPFFSSPPPPSPLFVSTDPQANPKRPRYTTTTGQWKQLPSPSKKHTTDKNPSPTVAAASSSDTASSPSNSPGVGDQHQLRRKGKYVSPVWKPNEMLWLARAWRLQYHGGGGSGGSMSDQAPDNPTSDLAAPPSSSRPQGRGKTRGEKDKEVAEFLQRHGVNRDAKTAGTKWDNMLGEFRKVYEWEREQFGKSYFRLSPYERKLHRLPASFDEEVFEELAQFLGSKMKNPHTTITKRATGGYQETRLAAMDADSFREDEYVTSSLSTSKGLRRIGKVRMVWEELVSLWGEEAEDQRGRVKVKGTSFLNADELSFLDDAMVTCTLEAFEDGNSPLKGFSVDTFAPGQQVKVFGRRKASPASLPHGFSDPVQLPSMETSIRSIPPWEFQDPTDYYLSCLRVPPQTLPTLIELPWYLQEPPPKELRFPLRKDLYRDLPQGKELFFTTSSEPLDCRSVVFEILSPIIRSNPNLTTTSRESFIGLWDDCINRVVSKFSNVEMVFIRKPSTSSMLLADSMQDQWPNVTGFVSNFCLWRGEETDRLKEEDNNTLDPSSLIIQKLFWSYLDIPYILGYYAIGYMITICAFSRTHDRLLRTDLHTIDLSTPGDRIKALVPCWRIAGLLSILADRCVNLQEINKALPYSDFERIDLGYENTIELTPNYMTRVFSSKNKWGLVKEIYDFLDHRIPNSEYVYRSSEKDLSLTFKPRGFMWKPSNFEQLVAALKDVTKALVALHDLSFMHRDLKWEKVMRRTDGGNEWFVIGFDEAASAPQIYSAQQEVTATATAAGAPETKGRGMHGVKVDVWGVGQMLKTCGLIGMPKELRELQKRCLDQNPEQRPTAADCYHHLLQLQSLMSAAAAGGFF